MLNYYNDLTVFLSTVFTALEFEIDYNGKPSSGTIELATKYAPESWCFGTKLMLGQALEGVRDGDDIIALPGAWGGANKNCFLGYLTRGVLQKKLEKISKKKVNIWFFNVNPAEIIFSGYTSVYNNLYQLKKYSKIKFFRSRLLNSIVLGTKKMRLAAKLREKVLSSYEVIDKKRLFYVYDKFLSEMIFEADDLKKSKDIFNKAIKEIDSLKKKKIRKKIKIGIVGDFAYTLFSLQPFFDIEKFLLSEGILINQPLSFNNYYSFLSPLYSKKNRAESTKIFSQNVAGSDAITVLSSVYLKNKVDGLIHLRTFGCMPEEIANEVLLSNKKNFPPILSLSYDAHTTEENLRVRIEAFIDMIRSKK